MSRIPVFISASALALVLARSSALAEPKDEKLPAAEIALAISDSEQANPPEETEDPVTGSPLEWDFYAMPESTRSWLFFTVPPESFDKLEENRDQRGQPLFP